MQNDERIKTRRDARRIAAEVADLAAGEAKAMPAEAREAFFDELARLLPIRPAAAPAPRAQPIEPFTDAQARMWGKQRIQFGIHQGTQIDQIPISYLERIADPNDFTKGLRRYLASHRVACEEAVAGD